MRLTYNLGWSELKWPKIIWVDMQLVSRLELYLTCKRCLLKDPGLENAVVFLWVHPKSRFVLHRLGGPQFLICTLNQVRVRASSPTLSYGGYPGHPESNSRMCLMGESRSCFILIAIIGLSLETWNLAQQVTTLLTLMQINGIAMRPWKWICLTC